MKKMIAKVALTVLPKSLHFPVMLQYKKFKGSLDPEFSMLEKLVGEGKRGLDIGANIGLYSYALSSLCDTVEAFEPQPLVYERLRSYQIPNLNCHNVGLSSVVGNLNLNIPIIDNKKITGLASFGEISGEKEVIHVPVKRLDDYEFNDVSFMKIDVEGYEKQVIEGALATIEKSKPNLLIELEQRHLKEISLGDMFSFIANLGYEGFYIADGVINSIDKFSFEKHQQPFLSEIEQKGYPTSKNYINNFMFVPRSSNLLKNFG